MEKATEVLENRNVILNYPIKLEEEGEKKILYTLTRYNFYLSK